MIEIESIHKRLERIEDKIDALQEFKVSATVSAKWISIAISGALGFLTMVITAVVNYYTVIKAK